MSQLRFMEELLAGADVEWKPLGEVAEYSKTRISFKLLDENNYVGVDNLLQNRAGKVESNYPPTSGNLIEYCGCDILIGNIRPYLKKIWYADRVGGTNGDVLVIHPTYKSINPRYLYQVLSDEKFFDYNMQHSKGAKMPRGNKAKIMEYSIPIPCPENPEKSLEIQAEIVRILDTFTELTAKLTTELTTELTARKKQHAYYRDLFFAQEDVEWKPLGEIGEFTRGKRFVKNDMKTDGFPCIHYGEMYTHYGVWATEAKSYLDKNLTSKLRIANHGDIIIVAAGETIEDIGLGTAWLGDSGIVFHDACFSFTTTLNPKYVSYYLRTDHFHKQIRKYISSGKISSINEKGLSKAKIPILPPAEQSRIVSILDKFDALTNSISEGLPREIELRQKQYEYYREQLLSFPKVAAQA